MRWHEEVLEKLTSAARGLLLLQWKKMQQFCLVNMGFNIKENQLSSFAMEIIILFPYLIYFWRLRKKILFILSAQCLII